MVLLVVLFCSWVAHITFRHNRYPLLASSLVSLQSVFSGLFIGEDIGLIYVDCTGQSIVKVAGPPGSDSLVHDLRLGREYKRDLLFLHHWEFRSSYGVVSILEIYW